MMFWQNKVVIITGSTLGIGWQLANELLERGAKVVLNARNAERLQLKSDELNSKGYPVLSMPGDISNYEICMGIVNETITHFGKVDVLINNAGLSVESNPLDNLNIDVFNKVMQVNMMGAVNMTKAVLSAIKHSKGSILFVSSLAGLHGLGNYAAYSSSKMALTAFAESLNIEMNHHHVHIGIAYVGFTQNDVDKTVLDARGNTVLQKNRNNVKPLPVKNTATKIIQMIERKTFKSVFTATGLLMSVIKRVSPGLLFFILLKIYRRETGIR